MQGQKIKLMEVCGTHTMVIAQAGIKKLLPSWVELVSGPGCPVCVTAQSDIDRAIAIARQKNLIMATFGDMLRVPGTKGSLEQARAEGADVRVVYSAIDALNIAAENPTKPVVFMGIGFETTSPTVAATLQLAKRQSIQNFFILSNFKLIFPALEAIAGSKKLRIDGFICPGHVSVITGSHPYQSIARQFKKPCVITGFEPADIIKGVKNLIEQISNDSYRVEIEYQRAVRKQGNPLARKVLNSVFRVCDAQWRGLGIIKKSGLSLKKSFARFSAEDRFKVPLARAQQLRGCACAQVLQGIKHPQQCRLFKTACTPAQPIGPCMVSSEGACAAEYKYS